VSSEQKRFQQHIFNFIVRLVE